MHSPRSTRGITLKTAYSNGLSTDLLQVSDPPARLLETAQQELDVGGAQRSGVRETGLASQPLLGHKVDDPLQDLVRESGSQRGVGLGDSPGEGQQYVVAGGGERALARGLPSPPGVVEVQRGPVVYEPQPVVPGEEVRVARGAVYVGHESIEPHDAGGEVRAGRLHEGIEAEGAGQVVEGQVQADARPDQVLYLRVWLGAGELGVEVGEHDLRDEQTQGPRDLARHYLRYERFASLTGAPELEDVGPEVVGLDDGRQRTAFPQRRHVARGFDRPEQRPQSRLTTPWRQA